MQNEKIATAEVASSGTVPMVSAESKKIAIVSYLTIIGLVVALILNNDKKLDFANFHIRQSLGLTFTSIALMIVGVIPILGWIISFLGVFFLFYLWVVGLISAAKERRRPVPLLGEKYEEWLKGL